MTTTSPKHCNCVPKLSQVAQSHKRWRVNTVFRFRLDRAARVTLKFTGKHGHNAGSLSLNGHRGANRVTFDGAISRHHHLAPGSYTVAISAALPLTGAPASTPVKLGFTIRR